MRQNKKYLIETQFLIMHESYNLGSGQLTHFISQRYKDGSNLLRFASLHISIVR